MSLNEEKMFILKMVESGKITSTEAAKLLEALDGGKSKNTENAGAADSQTGYAPRNDSRSSEPRAEYRSAARETRREERENRGQDCCGDSTEYDEAYAQFKDEIKKLKVKAKEWKKDIKKELNKPEVKEDFNKMVDDFSVRAEVLGKTFAQSTSGFADKVIEAVGSFIDTNAFNVFGNLKVIERVYEAEIADTTSANIKIEAINGQITLKKHDQPGIIIRSHLRVNANVEESAVDAKLIHFEKGDNNIVLSINKIPNTSVAHDVFIPATAFNDVILESVNGKIYVEDMAVNKLECKTKNASIELMGVKGEEILLDTRNARVNLIYTVGRQLRINTINAVIDMKHIKAEKLQASTQNGRIFIENAQNLDGTEKMQMDLNTTNAGIKINMNDMDNRGYNINAETTFGGINLLVPALNYTVNRRAPNGNAQVCAESSGLESFAGKVYINTKTSHGVIEITK